MVTFLILLVATELPAQTSLPRFQLLRAEEDWGVLAGESKLAEPWLRLKYIPLRPRWYLSLGADARIRYERYATESFGTATPDDTGYLQQRYMTHADLHAGKLRFFGQIHSVTQQFRRGLPRANDVDTFDVHQAFLEPAFAIGRRRFALRAGRQEIRIGSTRLTGIREGPNVRLSFDALRLTLSEGTSWQLDALAGRPVVTSRFAFDDKPESGRLFWGAYATRKLRPADGLSLDLYYLAHARRAGRFTQGLAEETRHSGGVRLWRPVSPKFPLDYDWEFVWQGGHFGSGRIHAWYAASETGYTLTRAPLRPRLGVKANVASGDRDPADRNLQTFHGLFPDTKDFREQVGPGPANSIIVRPLIEFNVPVAMHLLSVTFGCDSFWRSSRQDGIYTFGGAHLITGAQSDARYIGTKPSVVLQLPLSRFTTASIIYSHLFPGRFLKDVLPRQTPTYAAILLTFRM